VSAESDASIWTDTHCHVQDSYLRDPAGIDAVLARAAAAHVERLICIGTDPVASREALDLARSGAVTSSRPAIWATVGLHPHEAAHGLDEIRSLVESSASAERAPGSVVAIGECGLDYFYEHSPRDAQRVVFAEQIALAKRFDLALVVHTRDAWDDTADILRSEGAPARTVIHCFTGGPNEMRRMLDLGAYISFSGIVTFKKAGEIREAAALCPTDRLLVETDSPYLAPAPHRGHPNEPAYVVLVGAAVAGMRAADPDGLAETSSANAVAAFDLSP
jgi:TatD DNase family protein